MLNSNIDFFEIKNNFVKTENIESICIIDSNQNFRPKISIAIPTYKRKDFLLEAIKSALNQKDFNDYEILIVDNNPERGCETEEMMKVFANSSKIRYYKNLENIGMFGNWNRCITLAKGTYVTILNDDDYLLNNYLKCCESEISKNFNIDMLYVGVGIDKDNLIEINKSKIKRFKIFFEQFLFGPQSIGSLGILFKKNEIIKLGGFNDYFFPTSDYIFWTLCAKKLKKIYCITKVLCIYRLAANESLKINIQEKNIIHDSILREQISESSNLKIFIKPALPLFKYKHFLRICKFSDEFLKIHFDEKKSYKENVNYLSYFYYYFLFFYYKIKRILS